MVQHHLGAQENIKRVSFQRYTTVQNYVGNKIICTRAHINNVEYEGEKTAQFVYDDKVVGYKNSNSTLAQTQIQIELRIPVRDVSKNAPVWKKLDLAFSHPILSMIHFSGLNCVVHPTEHGLHK
jgi:hypothetical protein